VTFALVETSPSITSFPLSKPTNGGSRTMGLKKIVLKVERISEEEATYPSQVLSIGFFWIDNIWVTVSL
jgi:hypothetical protein